jgi:hypothetical protein
MTTNPRRLFENSGFRQIKAKIIEKATFTGVNEHFDYFSSILHVGKHRIHGKMSSRIASF